VPTLREAEAAGTSLDVDVDHQLLGEWPGGDSPSDDPLPDVPLPEAWPGGSVGEKRTRLRVTEQAMVVAFGSGSGSCPVCLLGSNLLI